MSTQSPPITTEVEIVSVAEQAPIDRPDVPIPLRKISADEILSVVGALLGSFCLVWVLFDYVLPFGGGLGFIVSWYFAFLALYAGITGLSHPRPVVIDRVMGAVFIGMGLLVGFVLVTVVVYTTLQGRDVLPHWNFFTQPASAGSLRGPYNKGGISNIIMGSLIQVSIAVGISFPLGIGTAVFMTEVGGAFSPGRAYRGRGDDRPAGPAGRTVCLRRPDPQIPRAPQRVRRLPGLGGDDDTDRGPVRRGRPPGRSRRAPRGRPGPGGVHWQTVRRIVLPTATPGLATALILSIARGIGESAPLLIVSGFTTFANYNPSTANR
jgi:phosphate transport system permease protein